MTFPTITVSQLNNYVKSLFDKDLMFSSVLLTGEISNFSPHYKTGHLYFSLKDETSSVKAVMFAREASHLRFRPENGMKVIAAGRVTVFERDGIYQLYVKELIPDGAGALAVAFEQLKKRLEAKGLFSAAHKKPLPVFPRRIGVITSAGGAALQDILNILGRRYPMGEVVLAGVNVQGQQAAADMIAALREMNRLQCADVIILGRGGGSAEDLWCYNDETLAYAIYDSEIPVISAVGHETDFTIADFVADLRAPTPSAAAELAAPDILDLQYRAASLSRQLSAAMTATLSAQRQKLSVLLAKCDFTDGESLFREENRRLEQLSSRMLYAFSSTAAAQKERFAGIRRRMLPDMQAIVHNKKLQTAAAISALDQLNPMRVLSRGYAIVESGGVVKTKTDQFSAGETISVLLADGTVSAQVTEISRRNADGKNNDV